MIRTITGFYKRIPNAAGYGQPQPILQMFEYGTERQFLLNIVDDALVDMEHEMSESAYKRMSPISITITVDVEEADSDAGAV